MDGEFREPDWSAPLDVEMRLASMPANATVKGMFLQSIADVAKKACGRAPGRGSYVAFKDYPLHEMAELMLACSELVWPRFWPREALRRLGQTAYPTFAASTIGKVVMSVAGRDPVAALKLVPKAYYLIGSHAGQASIEQVAEREMLLRLRGVWTWPDAYNVGVHEGGLAAWGLTGEVTVRTLSACDADLRLRWK